MDKPVTPSTSAPHDLSPRLATLVGFGAVMLWSTLAVLTDLKGPRVPPFETTAITFGIGGLVTLAIAAARGRLAAVRPTGVSLLLGIYGLFAYHALYFAALALAPAAEANLVAALWALLTVLFSGLLPGARLEARHVLGAVLGLTAAAILIWSRLGTETAAPSRALGFALALACAVVWASYSVLSCLVAAVPSESLAVACLVTSGLAVVCNLAFEGWVPPPGLTSWVALVLLGIGPVGAAFLMWDIGMKQGNVAQLGVLAYASPVISTGLLVLLGQAQPTWALGVACVLLVIASWMAVGRK